MPMPTNSYWNNNGKHQQLADKLQKLIPAQGSVERPRKNRSLEHFRKAVNCYYDLYNNGLCNRVAEFRNVFDISSSHYKYGFGQYYHNMYEIVEARLDSIIQAAAKEQGV